MIVIEGMDATGKSTLGRFLAKELGREIQESEGPPKSYDEFYQRILRYFEIKDTHVFVRHPLVSNPIYDLARRFANKPIIEMPEDLYVSFYHVIRPTFVYCAPAFHNGVTHTVKPHDTEDHLKMIDEFKYKIMQGYSAWATDHAHIVYRIGDSIDAVLAMVKAKEGI